ncbi:MAG: type II secretion system protein GspG [Phycisphaeraceae bacterium]|nr:type II secretion system protein GspG [Phycisphaerales bacterium]MCB9844123.1 type II secretion system protein GspG [Phycisphaeraceae bacterium]
MKSSRLGSAGLGILVVLIGLAIVLYLAFGNMGGKSYMKTVADAKDKAEDTVTHIYLNQIAQLVGMYELNNARYPNSMDELIRYSGDGGAWSNDPWGTQYTISVDKNTKTVHITSAGPDTQPGTADDQTFDQPIPM